MLHRIRLALSLFLLAMLLFGTLGVGAQPAYADNPDYDIANGHFYTQAAGPGAPAGTGFAITDSGMDERNQQIKFWSEFKRLGGVQALGYPASQRFMLDGFMTQATQRVLLQWRPEVQRVYFVNVFDKLHDMGKDKDLIVQYLVPAQLDVNDVGKPFSQVVTERQNLLNANQAIKNYYFSVSDPLQLNGLPTSPVINAGDVFDVIRCQRIVIQYWKKSVAGIANAGYVTVALGGDLAKVFGLVPQQAAQPGTASQTQPNPTPPVSVSFPQRGQIVFGSDFTDATGRTEVVNPTTNVNNGATVAFLGLLRTPNQSDKLVLDIFYLRNAGGPEKLLSEVVPVTKGAELVGGKIRMCCGLQAGNYNFKIISDAGTVLAEGTLTINP